jgi:siroheme synthase
MLPPHSVTVVVLMGLGRASQIGALLTGTGWRATTPVAVAFAAGTPEATTWTGTLATLGSCRDAAPAGAPGTIVIGQVASLANAIGSTSAAATAAGRKQESHVSHG